MYELERGSEGEEGEGKIRLVGRKKSCDVALKKKECASVQCSLSLVGLSPIFLFLLCLIFFYF